ncbi:hypothetical protein SAMN02910413_1659 [Pseudobutyrivibrio sp. C4]|nr:hypothetical protein SAMN02910413_1659 [Pseudobutyrivibrio sp. C4]
MNIVYSILKYVFCVVFGLVMLYRITSTKENEHFKSIINVILLAAGLIIIGIMSGKLDI